MAENKRYEIADYEELAKDNHRKLVPMRFLTHTLPFAAGEIAGFPPLAAKKLHDDGDAEPVDVDSMKQPSVDRREASDAETKRLDAIDIPPDVMAGHHLPRITLAKTISQGEVPNDTVAREIIEREQKRRTGGAVTSASLPAAKPGQTQAAT